VNKRYIKTFYGIVHGICSTKALLLGNVVFANRVLLGNPGTEMSKVELIFHRANFVSAATTALFFWNQVQSWQLSTTTMEEKGLTPRSIQKANQGRGVVAMLLFSLFPSKSVSLLVVARFFLSISFPRRTKAHQYSPSIEFRSNFVYGTQQTVVSTDRPTHTHILFALPFAIRHFHPRYHNFRHTFVTIPFSNPPYSSFLRYTFAAIQATLSATITG
jgi:hypothetical protein